jgi:hypothetical protein
MHRDVVRTEGIQKSNAYHYFISMHATILYQCMHQFHINACRYVHIDACHYFHIKASHHFHTKKRLVVSTHSIVWSRTSLAVACPWPPSAPPLSPKPPPSTYRSNTRIT